MAAISAKKHAPAACVLLLEKTDKWLAKVRISGGGRCNVTNALSEPRKFARNYPRGEEFMRKVLRTWGQPEVVHWFNEHGVELKAESDGRMFPITDDSATVIGALQGAARVAGVELRSGCTVQRLERRGVRWSVSTNSEVLDADHVVVATGGSPKDEGLEWLVRTGHTIVPAVPSLFTFNLPGASLVELMGVSVPQVNLRIEGSKLESSGPLLITHWGLSGPAVLRLSAFGARQLHACGYRYGVRIDWLGGLGQIEAHARVAAFAAQYPQRRAINANVFQLPARLWAYFLDRASIPAEKEIRDVGKKSLDKLLDVLTNDRHEAHGKTTFKEEFVTAGGIALHQVDPLTLESSVAPGLHFAGEVLDVDGITGGFNFQAAWSTGWLAGKGAVRSCSM